VLRSISPPPPGGHAIPATGRPAQWDRAHSRTRLLGPARPAGQL